MKRTVIVVLAAAVFASCVHDPISEQPTPAAGAERATVTLSVNVPSRTRVSTRAASSAVENDIKNMLLLIATDTDSNGTFHLDSLVVIDTDDIDANSTARVRLTLDVSPTPVKFIAVANMDVVTMFSFSDWLADLESGDDPFASVAIEVEEWKKSLMIDMTSFLPANTNIPMSGEATLPYLSARGNVNLPISLLRSVARADLQLNLGADSKSFVPTAARLHREISIAYHITDANAYDPTSGGSRVSAPSFHTSATKGNLSAIDIPIDATTGLFATTYVGEKYPPAFDKQTSDAACIIVEGHYNGSQAKSYYRVDFNSGTEGHPFGQVLRNWQYVFNITRITSAGYPTEAEALANPSSAITLSVEMWDQNVQQVNFLTTGDYMYVSTNAVELGSVQGDINTFTVRSTVDFSWQLNELGTLYTSKRNDLGATNLTADSDFMVHLSAIDESNSAYIDYTFTVYALENNNSTDARSGAVFITAGGATLTVSLTQRPSSTSIRKINVLVAGLEIGSMAPNVPDYATGTTATSIYPSKFRSILLNPSYFGPTGRVATEGFNLDYTAFTDFASTYTARLAYTLQHTDVLYMCYPVDPSTEVSKVICNWLWADPHRVLIVSRDVVTGTNPNLVAELNNNRLAGTDHDTASIQLGGTLSVIGAILNTLLGTTSAQGVTPAEITTTGSMANARFMQNVDMTTSFAITDNTGSGMLVPSGVIPLIYYGGTRSGTLQRSSYAALAVDPTHRIVYVGDSNMFYDQPVGTVASITPEGGPLNQILFNLWSWIVDTVQAP